MPNILVPGERVADPAEPRLSAWEARTDLPLTALAGVFLLGYAWQVLHTGATPTVQLWQEILLWGIWAVFAVDYVIRFVLAHNKRRFIWRHLFDLIVVALPMVRQLRALRLITVLRVLSKRFAVNFRGRIGLYVAATVLLVGVSASLAVLDAERADPDASITTFGDALWWTLTTITTVGYGDRFPVTTEGRLVAAALMIGGIALLGVVTGLIASWFLERIVGAEESIEETTRTEVRALRAELAELREELRRT
ncbi:Potassium voltage-gated channel subfamily KQT; possible potassium channel, VIC family [Alloactinosynnema sp. L-07]|uniref:potassium channel family protein n=1 Tax=Alloactinosynnema sp. L-07 TaxID=1653480 RepID=UPI00065EFF74|nr:potassium channel family protein [Alloactinosynnema sp. L-07]CRK60463.1 Potassium voltage-gated channel subfamily KQT; possible potassium channel, VIC family [Alloactinosynnema sp. L-07]